MKNTIVVTACLSAVLLLPFASAAPAVPQMGVIERTANLRHDPSSNKQPIRKLLTDEKVQILDSSKPDYFKVKTEEDKKTGWVYKPLVRVIALPAGGAAPPPPPPAAAAAAAGGAAPGVFPIGLPKQVPVVAAFHGSEGICKPNGEDGSDTKTNALKNRSDTFPEQIFDAEWTSIMALTYPAAPKSRMKWSSADLASIQPYEGSAVRTVGFLAHQIKIEKGTGEATNCHFTADDDVDWHLYLVGQNRDGIDKSVVIETTPRVRKDRQWDVSVLRRWVDSGKPVRISGYLMVDPEHRSMVGSARGTVWEIHPVMKIEVCNAATCATGDWVSLEEVH